MTENLNDHPQISTEAAQAAGFNTGDYGPTTHYAQVDGGTLQVPEMASTVAVNRGSFDDLDDRTPEGHVVVNRFPDKQGTLQTWLKEGTAQDRNGEDRVVVSNPITREFTTLPAEQYAKARRMNKERNVALQTTMPLGKLVVDTQVERPVHMDDEPMFFPHRNKLQ